MELAWMTDFKSELEKGLHCRFSCQYLPGCVVLRSGRLAVALVIYFAGNSGRIRVTDTRTFHIDQDQILKNASKICFRLYALLGAGKVVYGRQTVAARIEKKVALAFLEEHHLQVALPGKYRYGLFHAGELVSVAVFSGGRRMRDKADGYRSFELLRFCHKSGYRVVGGLSKLLKAFITDFQPGDIMTYVDRDWAQLSSLTTLGFREQGHTAPQAFWIEGEQRYPFRDTQELSSLRQKFPKGYLLHNQGSTKLVLENCI